MRGFSCNQNLHRTASFLFVVFCLLQISLLAAPLLRAHALSAPAVCQGDHALCGCAPARIAAGTCCCALASAPPCCRKEITETATAHEHHEGAVVTSLPCGSDDPQVTSTLEEYLLPAAPLLVTSALLRLLPSHLPGLRLAEVTRPPTPPPEDRRRTS